MRPTPSFTRCGTRSTPKAAPCTISNGRSSAPPCAPISSRFTTSGAPHAITKSAAAGNRNTKVRAVHRPPGKRRPPATAQPERNRQHRLICLRETGKSRRTSPELPLRRSALSDRLRLLRSARGLVLLLEPVNAPRRVYQLLPAGEERMARRADFHSDIALVGRAGLEGMSARADD